jgi:glycosyltransferase involved in cell wall biosynthesis
MVETAHGTRVSVCMAAYNGAAFIEEQISSILAQLGNSDELIVIDDGSKDNTVEVVAAIKDDRIRLSVNDSNVGYVRTFNRAFDQARGTYVLLADQDDLWADGRLDAMVSALSTSNVVAGNLEILGTGGRRTPSPLVAAQSGQRLRNIVMIFADRRGYWGCAMGVRREFLAVATPFPRPLYESHDLWLALLGNAAGSITHLEQTVTLRRVHGGNATPTSRRGIVPALRGRVMLLRCLLVGVRRLVRARKISAT